MSVDSGVALEDLATVSIPQKPEWPLFEIWLSGVLVCLGLVGYFSLKQSKKLNSRVPLLDDATKVLLNDCRKRVGINQFVGLSECTQLPSPALYGLFKPEIILPVGLLDELSSEEIEHVFLHELTHLKKGDNWWNCFFLTVQLLNWYNPLVWWFRSRTQELQEQACDVQVISYLKEPKAYASTLIKVLEFPDVAQWPRIQGVAYLTENKKQLKRRIKMIGKKQNKFGFVLTLVLGSGLALTGLASTESNTETLQQKAQIQSTSDLGVTSKGLVNNEAQQQILISSQFIHDNDILHAPQILTMENNTATLRIVQERYLPESWEKPEIVKKEGGLEIISANPVFGDITEMGVSLEVTPAIMSLPEFAGKIHLSGKVIMRNMADSKISQIEVQTERKQIGNQILATQTNEATFSLVTELGKTSEIKMTYEGKPLTIKIEAQLVDAVAKSQP